MATRGSLLTGRKLGSAPRAPVVPQTAVAMQYPDLAQLQREAVARNIPAPTQPQQPSGLSAAQRAEVQQFKKSRQDVMNRAPSSLIAMPTQRADENFLKQQEAAMRPMTAQAAQAPQNPSKAMQSYMAAEKAGTAGDMAKPALKKGGVVKKKPGYAKGGGVVAKKTAASKYAKGGVVTTKASNCGASMKPQQRKK